MQRSDAVDAVAAHDGEVGHAHALLVAFFNDRHAAAAGIVARKARPHFSQEPIIDFVDDLQVAGQHLRHQRDGPAFKGLGHHGVVGVAASLLGDVPGLIPVQPLDVDQQAHQFWNGESGVGVVELQCILLSKLVEQSAARTVAVHFTLLFIASDDVLQRC